MHPLKILASIITLYILSGIGVVHAKVLDDSLLPYQAQVDNIVQGFNLRDHQPFSDALDIEAILDKSLDSFLLERSFREEFRNSFSKTGADKLGQNILASLGDYGMAKLINIQPSDTGAQALMRLDFGDSGNGYMILDLITDGQGKVRVTDWFDYSAGQKYSASLSQLVALFSPTPTIVGTVFDIATDREEQTRLIMDLFEKQQQGDYEAVVKSFLSLDETLKSNRALNFFAVQAANLSGDDQLYLATLENVERHFSTDPTLQFVLVDYYFLKGDFNKAIQSLENIHQDFGTEDAAIYSMLSNAHYEAGEIEQAINHASRAIEIEPEYENGYWSLFSLHIQTQRWQDAVAVARILESRFDYDLGPSSLEQAGGYQSFIASPAYQAWK
ncbi:MAG: hypothetical protein HUJ29_10100 [Gammaproteobacteria bacterium]|nr:hypothetical protein [Gammaproteobacteria bacterium]